MSSHIHNWFYGLSLRELIIVLSPWILFYIPSDLLRDDFGNVYLDLLVMFLPLLLILILFILVVATKWSGQLGWPNALIRAFLNVAMWLGFFGFVIFITILIYEHNYIPQGEVGGAIIGILSGVLYLPIFALILGSNPKEVRIMEKAIVDTSSSNNDNEVQITSGQNEGVNHIEFNDDERTFSSTLIKEDLVSLATLAIILTRAKCKVSPLSHNAITAIVNNGSVIIAIDEKIKVIRFLLVFRFRPGIHYNTRNEFVGRANETIVMCKLLTSKSEVDELHSEYFLCYAGGICELQLIASLDLFVKTTLAAISSCGGLGLLSFQ